MPLTPHAALKPLARLKAKGLYTMNHKNDLDIVGLEFGASISSEFLRRHGKPRAMDVTDCPCPVCGAVGASVSIGYELVDFQFCMACWMATRYIYVYESDTRS